MAATSQSVTPAMAAASQRVQRVLARFELACPALGELQIAVQVSGRGSAVPQVVLLPAVGRPRAEVEIVLTPKGQLRTCLVPGNLTPGQVAALEELRAALREALRSEHAPTAPVAGSGAEAPRETSR